MQIYSVAKNVLGALGPRVKVPVLDSELKIPAECMRIVGALDAGAIIEQGENANGGWIKWADGTLICWEVLKPSAVTYQAWSSIDDRYIYSTDAIMFSAAFVAPPSVCLSGGLNNMTYGFVSGIETTNVSVRGAVFTFVLGLNTCNISYIAVGRWKA